MSKPKSIVTPNCTGTLWGDRIYLYKSACGHHVEQYHRYCPICGIELDMKLVRDQQRADEADYKARKLDEAKTLIYEAEHPE